MNPIRNLVYFIEDAFKNQGDPDNWLRNLLNWATGRGKTKREDELAEMQKDNELDLMREEQKMKENFHTNYESYPAQMSQLQQAGINPMVVFGNGGAGASASSGPSGAASSGAAAPGLSSLLGSLLSFTNEKKRIDNDYNLRSQELGIARMEADARIQLWRSQQGWYGAKTVGQENENSVFYLRKQDLEQNVELKKANIDQIVQWIDESNSRVFLNNEKVALTVKQASLVDKQIIAQEVQNVILKCQSKYSDAYFKAVKDYQVAAANIASFDSAVVKRYWDKKMNAAGAELDRMITEATKMTEYYKGEAFERMVKGKMTDAERTQFWGNLAGGVVRSGLNLAAGLTGFGAVAKGFRYAVPGLNQPTWYGTSAK